MPDGMEATPSHSRRLSREVAFQAIYMEFISELDDDTALNTAMSRHTLSGAATEFITELVNGVWREVHFLDEKIEPFLAHGWTLSRIAVSDLVVLRMATYELYFMEDMPPKVTISQAVDLAKRFGTADSGSFVNGVLGNLIVSSPKAEWEAPILVDPEPEEDNVIELLDFENSEEPIEVEEDVKVGSWVIKRDTDNLTDDEPV